MGVYSNNSYLVGNGIKLGVLNVAFWSRNIVIIKITLWSLVDLFYFLLHFYSMFLMDITTSFLVTWSSLCFKIGRYTELH